MLTRNHRVTIPAKGPQYKPEFALDMLNMVPAEAAHPETIFLLSFLNPGPFGLLARVSMMEKNRHGTASMPIMSSTIRNWL